MKSTLLTIGNAVLLLIAWLHLLSVLHFSLLTGLAPVLAIGLALGETLALLAVLRASVAGPELWRKVLPLVVAAACVAFSYRAADQRREQYLRQHGPPKRYYAW